MAEAIDLATLQKVGEGREAEMFAWGEGRILRLYRGGFARSSVDLQIAWLEAARQAGISVPAVYDEIEVYGRVGVVMERIPGTDMLTEIGRKPWRLLSIAGTCGRAHARLNSAGAPDTVPPVHVRCELRIRSAEAIDDDLRDTALRRLETLDEGDRLLHGDFHPGNVMERHGEAVVIDWSNAMCGPAEADFARSLLILQLGDPPPGTSLALRAMALVGRRIFRALYSRSYRRDLTVDEVKLRAWALPVAVARLSEGIEAERPAIMAHIEALQR